MPGLNMPPMGMMLGIKPLIIEADLRTDNPLLAGSQPLIPHRYYIYISRLMAAAVLSDDLGILTIATDSCHPFSPGTRDGQSAFVEIDLCRKMNDPAYAKMTKMPFIYFLLFGEIGLKSIFTFLLYLKIFRYCFVKFFFYCVILLFVYFCKNVLVVFTVLYFVCS